MNPPKSLIAALLLIPLASCGTNVTLRVSLIDYDTQGYVSNAVAKVCTNNPFGGPPVFGWTLVPSDSETDVYWWYLNDNGSTDCDFSTYDGRFYLNFRFNSGSYYNLRLPEYRFMPLPGKGGEIAELAETFKEMTFYVRQKRNPVEMYSLGGGGMYNGITEYRMPQDAEDAGFDMMKGDWTAPHGIGEVADFRVRKPCVDSNGVETASAALVFQGTGNGAYLDFMRPTSYFWSAYNADPQATYSQTFSQTNGFIAGTNDYIVLRTRAVTNSTGTVETAHYGKIYGGIRVGKKDANSQQWYFFFKSYALNPVPGDTNLEANIGRGTKTLVYRKRRGKGAGFP